MAIAASETYEERLHALLQRSWGMLINGNLVPAEGGETFATACPADGRFLARVPFAQRVDVHKGVQEVSLFPVDASKVRLTLFALTAHRIGSEAAPRRSRPIVCRLVLAVNNFGPSPK